MDWTTLSASVGSALLSGGIVGGLVSLVVSKRESRDRQDALTLDREKWEHEKFQASRADARQTCNAVIARLEEMGSLVSEANRRQGIWKDRAQDDPAIGAEIRALYESVSQSNASAHFLLTAVLAMGGNAGPFTLDAVTTLGDSFVRAQQAFGFYCLDALNAKADNTKRLEFIDLLGTALLQYRNALSQIH